MTLRAIIYSKFSIKHFGELTTPQLNASWFVSESSSYRFASTSVVNLAVYRSFIYSIYIVT